MTYSYDLRKKALDYIEKVGSKAEASHYQLRQMLSYKCTASGRKYVEVDFKPTFRDLQRLE